MSDELRGRSVALVGRGTELDRAIAVRCAEAGASVALGTVADVKDQEFAMNSIANETWSVGVPNFVRLMFAWNADAARAFAQEVDERHGPCDVLVVNGSVWSRAPFEDLSEEEWENALRGTLTAPFIVAQAFGRRMAQRGRGLILLVSPERPDGDFAERAGLAGVRALANGIQAWGSAEGVRCVLLDGGGMDQAGAGASSAWDVIREFAAGG